MERVIAPNEAVVAKVQVETRLLLTIEQADNSMPLLFANTEIAIVRSADNF